MAKGSRFKLAWNVGVNHYLMRMRKLLVFRLTHVPLNFVNKSESELSLLLQIGNDLIRRSLSCCYIAPFGHWPYTMHIQCSVHNHLWLGANRMFAHIRMQTTWQIHDKYKINSMSTAVIYNYYLSLWRNEYEIKINFFKSSHSVPRCNTRVHNTRFENEICKCLFWYVLVSQFPFRTNWKCFINWMELNLWP